MPDPTNPLPTDLPAPAAPSSPSASPSSDTDALVSRLAAEIRRSAPVAPALPPPRQPTRDELLAKLDDAGKQGAGKFAETFAETVLMPAQAANVRHAAQINRRIIERDPALGPLYSRYRDKIDARITEFGGDAYIAERGLDGLIRSVASEDSAYIDELADKRATERAAKAPAPAAAPAAPAPARPPTETVHAGAAPAPSATVPSEDEAIRAIEVSDADADMARRVFRMSPTDIKRQRHEIAKMERRYGALGIKQLGGIPIVSLSDMKTGNGSPYPSEED